MSFLISLEQYGIAWQLGQALYTSAFYVWETFVLYQIPPMLEEPSIISGVLLVISSTLTTCFFLLRNRHPAGLACWAYMIVALSPVLGNRPARTALRGGQMVLCGLFELARSCLEAYFRVRYASKPRRAKRNAGPSGAGRWLGWPPSRP
jgi:hypothetical protein